MNLNNPLTWKRLNVQHFSLAAGLAIAISAAFALSQPVRPDSHPNTRPGTGLQSWQVSQPQLLTEHVLYLVDNEAQAEKVAQEEYWTTVHITYTPGNELYQRSVSILNGGVPEDRRIIDSILEARSPATMEDIRIVDLRGR